MLLPNNKIQKSKISKLACKESILKNDFIAIEIPLEIRLGHDNNNFKTLAITMCSPDDIDDLIYGYLFTESIINKSTDIILIKTFDNELGLITEVILSKSIVYDKFISKRHGMIHASCGICGKTEFEDLLTFDYPKIDKTTQAIDSCLIQSLPAKLNERQQGFEKTGGLHASALFDFNGELIIIKEDIGRHNALDKLIGAALQQNLLPLSTSILLLSGRVSFELVHKSLIAGASILTAIGAPSSLGIEIAKLNNMQLIGFVKSDSYNIY